MPKNKLINIPIIPIFKEPFADFVIAFKFSSAALEKVDTEG